MRITLRARTAETVAIYFEKAQQPVIRRMLPQKAQNVEQALADFAKTQLPSATSYGRTIYADERYVGDIWIYGIDRNDTPNAMLSYCLFEPELWGKGIVTEAVRLFLKEVRDRFALETIGAFSYEENIASIRVLEKNCFVLAEVLIESGVISRDYQRKTCSE